MLCSSWESVTETCIQNCLKKARFIQNDVKIGSSSKDQPLLDEEWNAMSRRITNFNHFVDVNENITTAEMRNIQKIATKIQDDGNADDQKTQKYIHWLLKKQ